MSSSYLLLMIFNLLCWWWKDATPKSNSRISLIYIMWWSSHGQMSLNNHSVPCQVSWVILKSPWKVVAFILYKHYNSHIVVFLVQEFNSYVIPFQVWTLAPSPNTMFNPPPQTPLLLIFLEVELESSYCKQMYAKQTCDEDKVILVAYLEHYICIAEPSAANFFLRNSE